MKKVTKPDCEICLKSTVFSPFTKYPKAKYYGETVYGPRAYMCAKHYRSHGYDNAVAV